MTFPGSIKGCANVLSVSSSFILAVEQTNFGEESAFDFWTIVFTRKSFLYRLFIPSRPTGPRGFKEDASFLH